MIYKLIVDIINVLVPKTKPKCFVCNADLVYGINKCCGLRHLVNFDGIILEVNKEFLIISKKQDKYIYVIYTPDLIEGELLEEWYDDLTMENYEKFITRAEKLKALM